MSEPASISTGIAGRYAGAVYELATEANQIASIESDIAALTTAMGESADLNTLLHSPIYTRDEQQAAISAIAGKMGLSDVMANTLSLMASKRRLFVVPQLLQALRALIAEEKNEVTAEVVSAKALT
ncbi:MAG: ATP synthase F1 subunit delta, partial [Pseudomonadota bacterium]